MDSKNRFGHHRWDNMDAAWGADMEDHFSAPHENEGEFLWLDAHVLCTPAIADVDKDGRHELILAVTYFFDRDKYNTEVCS